MRRPVLFLTALYTLAWAPILLMRGIYWDGWIYYTQYFHPDFAQIWATQFGPLRLYIHFELFQLIASTTDPVFTARSIVFFSWLFAGILLYKILTRAFRWNSSEAFMVSAYYLVLPEFLVRFEIIHPYYSLANFLFVFAAYLYLIPRSLFVHKLASEVAAIIFFIASFFVNSIAVFYFAFLSAHAYLFSKQSSVISDVKTYIVRYWYLIVLPFAFIAFSSIFLKPYGVGAHYNELIIFREGASLFFVFSSMVTGFWSGIWTGVIWPLASTLTFMERKFFIVALLGALTCVLLLLRNLTSPSEGNRFTIYSYSFSRSSAMIIAASVLILLALFPYVAVGKPPHIYGYGFGLRHTLLLPLGMALLLYGTIGSLIRPQLQKSVHVALLSLSIAFLWYNFFLLDIDWYKQQAIMYNLPTVISGAPPSTYFVFQDKTTGLNWRGRDISVLEYSGHMTMLTGNREFQGMSALDFASAKNRGEVSATSSVYIVDITSRTSDDPRVKDWVYLKTIDILGGDLPAAAQEKLQIVLTSTHTENP